MDIRILAIFILSVSVFIQAFAAFKAFRLIRITGRRTAWVLISIAMLFMAFRRIVPLFHLISGSDVVVVDLFNESLGLLLSVIMAGGIVLIAPLFIEFNEAKAKILQARDTLEQQVQERTAQLLDANKKLQDQIQDRIAAENALKQAYEDLKHTQMQLIQSEKMATVGQLAAGVAHEINNPTGFVISNMDSLQRYVSDISRMFAKYQEIDIYLKNQPGDNVLQLSESVENLKKELGLDLILEDLPKLTNESIDGMTHISKIVKDLRSFSHSDDGRLVKADIHEVIQSALNIARGEIKYRVELVKDYGQVPSVYCFPQLLSQVFLNLIVNAAQAIPKQGKIVIRTFMDNNESVIEISDTGSGISPEIQKHIFEPFFTTKPVGKGTGLGLSMAYSIIERHKGTITVTSQVGEGSTFTIRLPQGAGSDEGMEDTSNANA
ncbi:MAG: ATP-binding protein [Candidatus Omnitrophota bacterium]